MNPEQEEKIRNYGSTYPPPTPVRAGIDIPSQELLSIAKRIDQFISDNGWSWCTMDYVYKILKVCHQ